jgi:ribosomal protein L37AE/L43A
MFGPKEGAKRKQVSFGLCGTRPSVVNTWRARVNHNIQIDCPSCEHETPKTIMHRFWQCLRTRTTWEQAFSFLYSLKSLIDTSSAWRPLNLEQCMFTKKLPSKFRKFSLLWSLIRVLSSCQFGLRGTI